MDFMNLYSPFLLLESTVRMFTCQIVVAIVEKTDIKTANIHWHPK